MDTPAQNHDIEVVLLEASNVEININFLPLINKKPLIDPQGHRINPHAQLQTTSKFVFKSLKSSRKQRQLNETTSTTFLEELIFELFLNFEPDVEDLRAHEFILMVRDSGSSGNSTVSFESYAYLLVVFKDENDHVPSFRKNYFQFSIYEWFGKSINR